MPPTQHWTPGAWSRFVKIFEIQRLDDLNREWRFSSSTLANKRPPHGALKLKSAGRSAMPIDPLANWGGLTKIMVQVQIVKRCEGFNMMNRPIIDCSQNRWEALLDGHVRQGREADLVNFDYNLHGQFCEFLADKYHLEFRLSRDPALKEAHLRGPPR
jgi:hypothetical protein